MPVVVERVHIHFSLFVATIAEAAGLEDMEDLRIVRIGHVARGCKSVGLVLGTWPALIERVLIAYPIEFVVSVDGPVEDMTVAASWKDLLVAVELVA